MSPQLTTDDIERVRNAMPAYGYDLDTAVAALGLSAHRESITRQLRAVAKAAQTRAKPKRRAHR